MTPSYLRLTVTLLLLSQTVTAQSDFIEIDGEDEVAREREPRQVPQHEGSGWDFTTDDEDTAREYGSTTSNLQNESIT